jgi:hypothetical protein
MLVRDRTEIGAPSSSSGVLEGLDLPQVREIPIRNSSDFYGASEIAAAYCGIPLPQKPPRGLWHHGWVPVHYASHPELIVPQDYGGGKHDCYWVAREDQVRYLSEHGYTQVGAIGVPIVYLREREIPRRKGSLLVMPVHTQETINASWKFEEYAQTIAAIRDQFSQVVVCVHPSCYKRGYWVSDFRKLGFEVVSGARAYDANALERMRYLLSTFEYMTTNGIGSHLAYGAFCGAKVSIYGPFAEYKIEDMKRDPFRARRPHLLEASLEVTTRATVYRAYPELFCHPLEAKERVEWGRWELGWDHRRSPAELRECFEWTPREIALYPLRARLQAVRSFRPGNVRNLVPEPVRHAAKWVLRKEYREEQQEQARLERTPRFVLTTTRVNGKPFQIIDSERFLREYRELFEGDLFRFTPDTDSPYIVDGAAGVGLLVAYFRNRFPNARITALEPDEVMGRLLRANARAAGWEKTQIRAQWLWPFQVARAYMQRGGNAVSRVGRDDEHLETVTPAALPDLLTEPVDFLRLDLEDADLPAFRECVPALCHVKRIVVDYYSTLYDRQSLHELLALLSQAGFRAHIHTTTTERRPFSGDLGDFYGIDQRLRIFGIRR